MTHTIALVDCNNFYVSCERHYNRALEGRPVVVLSNNDHCVVARSNEVKSYISMGMPYFQCKPLIEQHQILVFSSNYSLYQDASDRVMRVLASFGLPLEVSSIDEAYLDLSSISHDQLVETGQRIRAKVEQYTGIPISLGIAPTKTLAKIAMKKAKTQYQEVGVFSLMDLHEHDIDDLLTEVQIADIWGIGNQSRSKLEYASIQTARDLKYTALWWVRRHLTVTGERTVLELRGLECLPIQTTIKPAQTITRARSFGRPVLLFDELKEALACYTSQAAETLRRQQLVAGTISVFVATNPFRKDIFPYTRGASSTLSIQTAFTPTLIREAIALLSQIYRPHIHYQRVGVTLSELSPQEILQHDLFGKATWSERHRQMRLMQAVDQINRNLGPDTIFLAIQGIKRDWQMVQRYRSQRYATRWNELLTISNE